MILAIDEYIGAYAHVVLLEFRRHAVFGRRDRLAHRFARLGDLKRRRVRNRGADCAAGQRSAGHRRSLAQKVAAPAGWQFGPGRRGRNLGLRFRFDAGWRVHIRLPPLSSDAAIDEFVDVKNGRREARALKNARPRRMIDVV
jgi:hypothetical protein